MADAPNSDLSHLRAEIDRIDDGLLDLLRRRADTCGRIAEYKRDNGIPMMQQARLDALKEKIGRFAEEHDIDREYLASVFDLITGEACRLEEEIIGDGTASVPALASRARRIDHVAIAVQDLDEAVAMFRDGYGFTEVERTQVKGEFSGMTMATMRAAGVTFVLCQGDSAKSNVCQYIDHYGPGVQHIAIQVRDQEGLAGDLEKRGAPTFTGIISSPGLDQSFTKRDGNTGIQLEFVTRTNNTGFNNVQKLFAAMERENVY